jgi:hypothetical protein
MRAVPVYVLLYSMGSLWEERCLMFRLFIYFWQFAAKICLLTSFRDTCFVEIVPQYQAPQRGRFWMTSSSFTVSCFSILLCHCAHMTDTKPKKSFSLSLKSRVFQRFGLASGQKFTITHCMMLEVRCTIDFSYFCLWDALNTLTLLPCSIQCTPF